MKPRQVVQAVLGLLLAAALLVWGLPHFAKTSWSEIWGVVSGVHWTQILVYQVLMLVGLYCYTFTFTGSLHGLSHPRALIVNLCGSSVSNLLPGGGAVGLAATYAILRSWGFSRRDTSTSAIVTGVWNLLARIALPVLAIFALWWGNRDLPDALARAAVLGLISGLVGFGVYFLARRRHALARRGLRLTLDRLESMAQPARGGLAWVTPAALLPAHHRRTHPEGMIDLGIAHGVPGVVAFYSAVLLARVLPGHEEASLRRSLLSAVGFLETHRQPQREHAAFDWCVAPGVAGRAARTAWCYGDPGVALALLRASWALQDHALYDRALSLARACATRPDDECAVQDAGLCHGAAGLGHLFRRLGDATGDEVLREGARRWFRNTLALRRPDELAGFPAFETADAPAGQGTYRASPGILAGAAGVGLALMSALGASADWDQRLLLDLTPAG